MKKIRNSVVVGAGPAGLSAALGLLAEGFSVTVLERHAAPPARVCGSFLSPEALQHLSSLGLLSGARAFGAPVRAVTFFARRGRTLPLPKPGLALPRSRLEGLLWDAVERRGGRLWRGVAAQAGRHAKEILWQGPGLPPGAGSGTEADLVVWADGRFSGGRQKTGDWYGWNAEFEGLGQKPGELSLFLDGRGYVGALTFGDGTTNLCGLHRRPGSADWEEIFQSARRRCPALERATATARRISPWRGAGPLPFTGKVEGGRAAVGDAAGVGDPFFGEGVGRALAAGPLLRRALAAGGSLEENLFRLQRAAYRPRFILGRLGRAALGGFSSSLLSLWPKAALPWLAFAHGPVRDFRQNRGLEAQLRR